AKIPAPVLLITGDRRTKLHGHMQDALRPCIKQVNNATIADAGHMMFHANPTAFVFEVQDFIMPQ
ncbi:MAG: alpha/beta hydrolase, partial [Gammaproteobacteria bacterium]